MEVPNAQQLLLILWRRKAWVAIPLLLGAIGGVVAGRMIPPSYRSSAEVLIEPPKVAEGLVKRITSMTVDERLVAVRKHITNRERIERLVKEFELYPELLATGQLDRAVGQVRSALKVRVGRDKVIRIELTGGDPRSVAEAVNRIAEEYVEAHSVLRERESGGTVDFMEDQLEASRQALEEHEAKITRFKADNLLRLPEQRGPHTRALEAAESKRLANLEAISSAEMRLALLRQGMRPIETAPTAASPTAARLEEKRRQLRELRSNFTDQHPDVIRLQREVEALEVEVAATPEAPAAEPSTAVDPLLAAEIAQVEFQLEDLKIAQRQIQADIQRYRSYLAQIPAVEQQLLILDREHDNLRGFFQQNLKRRTEIGMAEDLERGDYRETMSIVERATPPAGPYSPNKPFLLVAGLGLGGFLGLGLALARDHLEGGFEGPEDLRRSFPGVSVLTPIPRIRTAHLEPVAESAPDRKSA